MRNLAWGLIAKVVTRPAVTDWLAWRAFRTPYAHIYSKDGSMYMGRWWLFNPYPAPGDYRRAWRRDWMPSIRIHHIMRPDLDRHLHDHPRDARTIILRGWYREERLDGVFRRESGHTGRLLFGEYHRIQELSSYGVWTLFFTWRYRGTWGFLVDGKKVPSREYLGLEKS